MGLWWTRTNKPEDSKYGCTLKGLETCSLWHGQGHLSEEVTLQPRLEEAAGHEQPAQGAPQRLRSTPPPPLPPHPLPLPLPSQPGPAFQEGCLCPHLLSDLPPLPAMHWAPSRRSLRAGGRGWGVTASSCLYLGPGEASSSDLRSGPTVLIGWNEAQLWFYFIECIFSSCHHQSQSSLSLETSPLLWGVWNVS